MPRPFLWPLFACVILGAAGHPLELNADAQSDLQNQIDALKNEIARLQTELNSTTEQKQTLQGAIKELDLQIQKLTKSIALTNAQIIQKDKQIAGLSGDITTTQGHIQQSQASIADLLRQLAESDRDPLMAVLLGSGTLSSFFDETVTLGTIRDGLQNRVEDLSNQKTDLTSSKTSAEVKRRELASLKANLASQKQGLSIARSEQAKLLAETKDKESNYQALIAQKKAEESAFEDELITLAAGLASADTSTAPKAARGILNWPLDTVFITQYFGNTTFAQSGAYSGSGHNGIDFRAGIGTPVKAALSGTVQEINQGAVKYCQYGKWVLVRHDNGLTSLYAHLSGITVSKGERVSTGEVVGYSGNTGYATGPHLHLTLYISSAVTFKQYTCNSGYTAYIPIAPLNAYLNPLSYLPAL